MQSAHASYVTFEPPDIVYWHLIGRVEESDILRIYKAQFEFAIGKPYVLILIDVTRFDTITAAGRRAAATGPDGGKTVIPVRGSMVIGASFHVQVLGLLVAKASKAIHRNNYNDNVLSFCDTEAQARAWVEKRRRELEGLKNG
jgi:hypothetical protein